MIESNWVFYLNHQVECYVEWFWVHEWVCTCSKKDNVLAIDEIEFDRKFLFLSNNKQKIEWEHCRKKSEWVIFWFVSANNESSSSSLLLLSRLLLLFSSTSSLLLPATTKTMLSMLRMALSTPSLFELFWLEKALIWW